MSFITLTMATTLAFPAAPPPSTPQRPRPPISVPAPPPQPLAAADLERLRRQKARELGLDLNRPLTAEESSILEEYVRLLKAAPNRRTAAPTTPKSDNIADPSPRPSLPPSAREGLLYVKGKFNIKGACDAPANMGPLLIANGYQQVLSPMNGAVIVFAPKAHGCDPIAGHAGYILHTSLNTKEKTGKPTCFAVVVRATCQGKGTVVKDPLGFDVSDLPFQIKPGDPGVTYWAHP
jgi:hypothetical protein